MSAAIVGAVLLFILGIVGAQERCNCNYISHPQRDFCDSAFAFHGLVTSVVSVPAPWEEGATYNTYVRYNISVGEIFKGRRKYLSTDHVSAYSPKGGLCGKTTLYQYEDLDVPGYNQYLITGDIVTSTTDEKYLVITNCNWVVPWLELTEEQKEGLRGLYSDCTCQVAPRSGPLGRPGAIDEQQFEIEECLYNPIGATIVSATDCETDYGYCVRGEGGCRWAQTSRFQDCFNSRGDQLTRNAAAVTARRDCSAYSGKQRKKCLLKLFKSRANGH